MTDFVAICYNRCASCFCGHCDTRTRAKTHQTSNERTPLLSECDLLRTEGLSNRIVEESAGVDHSLTRIYIGHYCYISCLSFNFQNELKDVEEKFKKAMVANAGLDNEKSALNYQVSLSN